MNKNISIETRKKIGLFFALTYWVLCITIAVISHIFIVMPEMTSKNSIGGEMFLVPLILYASYLFYKVVAKRIRKFIW